MNYIKNSIKIFPARLQWEDGVYDLNLVDRKTEKLRLVSGTIGIEKLNEFSQLKNLWCFNINREKLENICKCKSLENLYIETLKADNLSCLRNLPSLKVLSLDSCSKVDSLVEIGKLQNLEGLKIENFKNVFKIESFSALTKLEQLAIAGSMWTRMKIESLRPLSALKKLKYLDLTNLKAEDESLKPLVNLSKLEELNIANFYPMEEFAWLAGKLLNTKCTWFSPYIELPFKCLKCGKDTTLMLTGKGKRDLCKECDSKRLEKHIKDFEKITLNESENLR